MKYLFSGNCSFSAYYQTHFFLSQKQVKEKMLSTAKCFTMSQGTAKIRSNFQLDQISTLKNRKLYNIKTVIEQSIRKFYDPKGGIQRLWTLK